MEEKLIVKDEYVDLRDKQTIPYDNLFQLSSNT